MLHKHLKINEIQGIDVGILENIKKLMGNEFPKLVDTFLNNIQKQFTALKYAIAYKNKHSIKKIAHNMAGSTANMGFTSLYKIFKKIEKTEPEKLVSQASMYIKTIDHKLSETTLFLKEY